MAIIKGQNLRLIIDGQAVAFATDCTVHIAAQTEDASTKDSTSGWAENEITGMSWDCSTNALCATSTESQGALFNDLMESMLSQSSVTIELHYTTPGSDYNQTPNDSLAYTGEAIISDFSLNAANRQNATYSIQLTGTGSFHPRTS